MDEEGKMLRRLKRRLASARASVMLEFAFVAPLVAVVAIFSADFTRILRTEQQLEIANRLAADVEAHMADYYAKGESPSLQAKNICKRYLVNVAHVATETGKVYMKGGCGVIKNPISVAIAWVADFLDGSMFDDGSLFLKILGKLPFLDDDIVAGVEQLHDGVAADEAGAACYEYFHCSPFLVRW